MTQVGGMTTIGRATSDIRKGRRVILREIQSNDFGWLYAISTASATGFRWRYRGTTPRPEEFANQLWSQVLSQYIVARADTGESIGLVVCYNPNFPDSWAYLAAIGSPKFMGTGAMVEGVALFLDEVFRNWNFRKLYMEAPEFNVDQVRSGLGGFFHEEGRMKDHHFYDGKYHDQLILALYRDEYEQMAPFIRHAIGMEGEPGSSDIESLSIDWPDEALDLDAFCNLIAEEFDRSPEEVLPDARLVEDLGFDSLDMMSLIVILEELTGVFAMDAYERLITPRETWLYYCELVSCQLTSKLPSSSPRTVMARRSVVDLLDDITSLGNAKLRFLPDEPDWRLPSDLGKAAYRAGWWWRGITEPGEAVAAVLTSSFDCLSVAYGAWLAGLGLVSLPHPARGVSAQEYVKSLETMCALASARILVMDPAYRSLLPDTDLEVYGFDSYRQSIQSPRKFPACPYPGYFVQFSSGSTSDPKGIVLPLGSLGRAIEATVEALEPRAQEAGVSWLPLSHDMGFIGVCLAALGATAPPWNTRGTLTLIRPEAFLARPSIWLRELRQVVPTNSCRVAVPLPTLTCGLQAMALTD